MLYLGNKKGLSMCLLDVSQMNIFNILYGNENTYEIKVFLVINTLMLFWLITGQRKTSLVVFFMKKEILSQIIWCSFSKLKFNSII